MNGRDHENLPPILDIKGLEAGYSGFPVLRGVSVTVPRGTLVTVIGPNGSGKSTMLKAVYGLVDVTAGEISLNLGGGPISLRGLQPFQITALGVNYLPQLDRVFRDLTVLENLQLGASRRKGSFSLAQDEVLAWFPVLQGFLHKRAGALSGGQQVLVALARALISAPSLLLVDEPSAGLAPALVTGVFDKIEDLRNAGISILAVEQNARRMLRLSDYAYVLDQGTNSLEGPGQDLLDDPRVVELYLGKVDQREQHSSNDTGGAAG